MYTCSFFFTYFFEHPLFSFCQGLVSGLDNLLLLPKMAILILVPTFKLLIWGGRDFKCKDNLFLSHFSTLGFLSNSLSRHLLCQLVKLIKTNISFSLRKLNFGCAFQSLSQTLGKTVQSSCIQPKREETYLPLQSVTLDKVELSKVRFISTSDEKCSQHSTKAIRMTNRVRFYFLKFLFHLSRSFVLIKNLSGTAVKKRNSVD